MAPADSGTRARPGSAYRRDHERAGARGGRLDACLPWLDAIAVSCDGPEPLHNLVRGHPTAFARLVTGLRRLADTDLPVGIIHTVTHGSWPHLTWLGDFAVEHGAGLLQLHPLEMTGRAFQGRLDLAPGPGGLARTWLLAQAVAAQHHGELAVQIDVLTRAAVRDHGPGIARSGAGGAQPADVVDVLVAEPDGAVVPLSYGFSRDHAVCNLFHDSLADAWDAYERDRVPALGELCARVRDECLGTRDALFSWHELLVARSHRAVVTS